MSLFLERATSYIPIAWDLSYIFHLEESEAFFMRHIQVGQSDARIQAASLPATVNMDGIALMDEVPGLAVDCRRSQTGRL